MFSLENSGIELKKLKNNIPVPEMDTRVGKPVQIGDRTIYPVIQTYVTKGQDFVWIELFPFALVICEGDSEYVVFLIEEEIDPQKLIEMVEEYSKKS